ncbi:bifunctional DNA primase/polymerase [Aurantimonas sp. MSK8Z-1]|nr:bifunctional DNA primase/polymerase [Aurantimonas sp. MSK8Z-1]
MDTHSLAIDVADPAPAATPPTYINFSDQAHTSVGEIHFGDIGPLCARQGWAVFPQERDGARKPGRVDEEILKWSKFQDQAPSVEDVDRWARQAWTLNVAAIMGKASNLCFALDIDVTDDDLSFAIQDAAARTLGETELQRIGNWPKIVLIYRVGKPEDLPPNRTLRLLAEDGVSASEHAVEFAAQGKAITIHGRHHKTGQRFSWPSGKMPSNSPPALAPLVTPEQIEAFVHTLGEIRKIKGDLRAAMVIEGEDDPSLDTTDLRTPPPGRQSTENREAWLAARSFAWARWNAGIVAPAVGGQRQVSEEGLRVVGAALKREILATLTGDAKRPTGVQIKDGMGKLAAAARKIAAGGVHVVRAKKRLETGEIVRPVTSTALPTILTTPAPVREFKRVHLSEHVGHALPLDESSRPQGERVTAVTAAAIKDFIFGLRDRDPEAEPKILAVASPVGAGKTTGLLRSVDDVIRVVAEEGEGRAPRILVLMPQHKLMAEAQAKAAELGINSMIYLGKAHPGSGCAPEMKAVAEVLEEAGIPTSGQCRSSRVEDGETVKTFCKYNPDNPDFDASQHVPCPFILRQRELARVDLAFAAHAYATCPAPKEIKNFDAVVVDESLASQLIKTKIFPLRVLAGDRAAPYMTKTEAKARCGDRAPTAEDREDFAREKLEQRSWAAKIFLDEIKAGRDPAVRFLAEEAKGPEAVGTLRECLEAAKLVTGRAQRASREITPSTTMREAQEMAGRKPGKNLIEEHKMWILLEEQIERRRRDREQVAACEALGGGTELCGPECKEGQNPQIWPLAKKRLQISWMSEWNFADKPALLLDATADEEILARCFGREVEVRRVEAPFRLRTILAPDCSFTKSRLVPDDEDTPPGLQEKERLLEDVRRYIVTVATLHGDGGVLVVAPKAVRKLLAKIGLPGNVDFMHFGACRGLDWAKSHSACVLVGACYPDALEVDGMTAALTAGDPDEVKRLDPDGTGKEMPFEAKDRRIPMRDGRELVVVTPEYKGGLLQSRLLHMVRDAELVQALGRLRPIHREDAAELHILGTCVPAGVVVDHVTSVQAQPRRFGNLFDAALGRQGVVSGKLAESAGCAAEFEDFREEFTSNPWLAKSFAVIERNGMVSYVAGYVPDDELQAMVDRGGGRILSLCKRKSFERPGYVDDLNDEETEAFDDEEETVEAPPEAEATAPASEPVKNQAVTRMIILTKAGLSPAQVLSRPLPEPGEPGYDVFRHRALAPDVDEIPF